GIVSWTRRLPRNCTAITQVTVVQFRGRRRVHETMPDILLVEDKDSLRRVLRLTLENAGYTVNEAADARSALNEIANAPHKLVLTDLRMPNGSGLDVLRAAR